LLAPALTRIRVNAQERVPRLVGRDPRGEFEAQTGGTGSRRADGALGLLIGTLCLYQAAGAMSAPGFVLARAGQRDAGTPSRALSLKGGRSPVVRCSALCLDGTPCSQIAVAGTDPPRCSAHGDDWEAVCPINHRCTAVSRDGSRCRRWAVHGTDPPRCPTHVADSPDYEREPRRCGAVLDNGRQCRCWAIRGSDPPRCYGHSGGLFGPPPEDRRCTVVRDDGGRCRNWSVRGSDPPRCRIHGGQVRAVDGARRCSAVCRDGSPCRGLPVIGTDPPRCLLHLGEERRPDGVGRSCTALCKDGSPCPKPAARGTNPPRCHSHGDDWPVVCRVSQPCTAVHADGSPCNAYAVRGSQPARCAAHGGSEAFMRAHRGHQRTRTHGYYVPLRLTSESTIDDLIDHFYERFRGLDRYLHEVLVSGKKVDQRVVNLLVLHRELTARLSRLLRNRQTLANVNPNGVIALTGVDRLAVLWAHRRLIDPDDLQGLAHEYLAPVIGRALDELSEELGVEL